MDHAILNQLTYDPAEQQDLAMTNSQQTTKLADLAEQTRSELGDWNQDGSDRHASTYPGSLQRPDWSKPKKKQKNGFS